MSVINFSKFGKLSNDNKSILLKHLILMINYSNNFKEKWLKVFFKYC